MPVRLIRRLISGFFIHGRHDIRLLQLSIRSTPWQTHDWHCSYPPILWLLKFVSITAQLHRHFYSIIPLPPHPHRHRSNPIVSVHFGIPGNDSRRSFLPPLAVWRLGILAREYLLHPTCPKSSRSKGKRSYDATMKTKQQRRPGPNGSRPVEPHHLRSQIGSSPVLRRGAATVTSA